jgi:ankyrin repeat protein
LNSTPLHLAARQGHLDIVRILLDRAGANTNARDWLNCTPLHGAASEGHLEIVRILLDRAGSDANARDKYNSTPLHLAAEQGHLEIVQILLAQNADANAADDRGWTPLDLACCNEHWEVAQLLIEQGGASVNVQRYDGGTPLHIVCSKGGRRPVDVAQLMLDRGADASIKDVYGDTPLSDACDNNDYNDASPEMLRLLVRAYPPAVCTLPLEQLQRLVEHFPGALRVTTEAGDMPLHEACRYASDWEEEILFMVEHDSTLARETNRTGRLALHEACIGEAPLGAPLSVIECLVQACPEALSTQDSRGCLPLHLAAMNHVAVDVMEFLLRRDETTIDARDQHEKTPLIYACETDAPLDLIYVLLAKNPEKAFEMLSGLPSEYGTAAASKKMRIS